MNKKLQVMVGKIALAKKIRTMHDCGYDENKIATMLDIPGSSVRRELARYSNEMIAEAKAEIAVKEEN